MIPYTKLKKILHVPYWLWKRHDKGNRLLFGVDVDRRINSLKRHDELIGTFQFVGYSSYMGADVYMIIQHYE